MKQKKTKKPKTSSKQKSPQKKLSKNIDPNPQIIEAYARRVDLELEKLIKSMPEFDAVDTLSQFTGSIAKKLIKMYDEQFPKKCNCCGRIYLTRNEYIEATHKLKWTSTVFEDKQVQEYRNCVCGSTLLIITDDRRDNTDFGHARRKLFDICVEKLEKISSKNHKEIVSIVRKIFRHIIDKTQVIGSLKDYDFEDPE